MKDFTARFAGLATLALAALPMAALTTAAHAQPASKMVVADLNLASPAGQRAATSRIAHLSHEFCATERNITQKAVCEDAITREAQEKVAAIASTSQFASSASPAR